MKYCFPLLFPIIIIISAMISACGYRFAGEGNFPSDIKNIRVAMLENRTAETGAETIFTNDLITEFTRNGSLAPDSAKGSGGILSGIIKFLNIETVSRRGSHIALERQVTVSADMALQDADGNEVWSAKNVRVRETYAVVSDKLATEHNRREAVSAISERMAEMVYDRLSNHF